MSRNLVIALAACAVCEGAWAGPAEGSACATKLNAEGRQIYEAAAPGVNKDADLKALLRKHARGLVMAGKMSADTARANAESAGLCLKALRD